MKSIQHLTRNQVDTTKWDRCVQTAPNGLIYAYSFYLDHMAANWDALVAGDYEAVMPLPWKKKGGIKYIYPPFMTQQLGIYCGQQVPHEQVQSFLAVAQQHFRYGSLFLNYHNGGSYHRMHSNFVLSLQPSYQELHAQYHRGLINNLKVATRYTMQYEQGYDVHALLKWYKKEHWEKMPHLGEQDFRRFRELCSYAQQEGILLTRVVKNALGEPLSAILLFCHNKRMYLMVSVTNPHSRTMSANAFLLDQLVKEFAGSGMLLDFEGSDLPGVAHFFQSFGSIDQPYAWYGFNRLPWWIKWIK